jgi:glycosyltransferase involved in cell wall biosynthesis
MHFRFITSTPLNVIRGSGTFAGIVTLARFLEESGSTVELVTPRLKFPIYTIERILFNEMLRFGRARASSPTVSIGFDMDGYTVAGTGTGTGLHVASIKGVIADELRFETGLTRATLRLQAHCEHLHVERSDLIIAPSSYAASRIQELYHVHTTPRIVPEPIDLVGWRRLLQLNPAQPSASRFTVLSVCRFYPRKRLHLLLGAAARLRSQIPELEVRIVGDGPQASRLKSICRQKGLSEIVNWLGNVSQEELAHEYNRCHMFCLPSVQESFGIVFLEAMASAKPIVAARAASAPEVVVHGILVEPDNEEALAEGIERLYKDPALRANLSEEAARFVRQFDAPQVAASFLREVGPTTTTDAAAAIPGRPSSAARQPLAHERKSESPQ